MVLSGGDVPARGLRERRVPPPELGRVLRAARQRAGLGLRELGRLVRLSPGYLVNLESGLRCPSRTPRSGSPTRFRSPRVSGLS
ncbi:helix-turn-helix transcriptional regulator [Kitasatospora sp. NPDC089797]|uniref:helix-turn-helix domain-containing protein n=1 Tax=Kitasatospora sp. NPDC089797 TaxID=3155298 RepID=UPI0034354CF1